LDSITAGIAAVTTAPELITGLRLERERREIRPIIIRSDE